VRIAIVSDAWAPQVNGVVRTLTTTVDHLRRAGHEVLTITPDRFTSVPCPSYAEIRLAVLPGAGLARMLGAFQPDAIHIATEGPLGWAARRWCLRRAFRFTTSFHTRFPDYLAVRTRLPADWFWASLRRFHKPAAAMFVATDALEAELADRGFGRMHRWSRGVDLSLFKPDGERLSEMAQLPGPIALHVGRVAPEKNIETFLQASFAGSKVVVGDGPALAELAARYPEVHFLGALHGQRLAAAYRSADVLAFPSLTDTFGLVIIEALASGTPVAACPSPNTQLLISDRIGAVSPDFSDALTRALAVHRDDCVAAAQRYSWERCTAQFLDGLEVIRDRQRAA
jgi:glycosyltransferase involved in cell wall biosynthesis